MSALVEHRADSADDRPRTPGRRRTDSSRGGAVDERTARRCGPVEPGEPAGRGRARPPPGTCAPTSAPTSRPTTSAWSAQLYAITLDAGEAHDVVQDAYSRAWRHWATVGRPRDPTAWVRRVAVRSTIRSWRRAARPARHRPRRRPDRRRHRPAHRGHALRAAPAAAAERRAVVLTTWPGCVGRRDRGRRAGRRTTPSQARLSRGRRLITEGLADVLPAAVPSGADGAGRSAPEERAR